MNTTSYPNDNFGLPPELTPHNPANLTREQVGKDYRLLATTEIWERPEQKIEIEKLEGDWHSRNYGLDKTGTYRVPINHPLDPDPSLKQPEWKLPDPPVGHKWHRDDWTQDMLPDGYRPLLECEMDWEKHGDIEWRDPSDEQFQVYVTGVYAGGQGWFRTKRRLPGAEEANLNGPQRLRTLITDLVNNATTAQDLHLAAQLVGVLAENLFSED